MQDMAVFRIGYERTRWLAARVAAVASNVANADTPGYRARDVPTFEDALDGVRVQVVRTSARHLAPEQAAGDRYGFVLRDQVGEKHSGNSVSLDAEMATLGEARGQQAAVAGVIGAFHRMLLASVRG